MRLFELMPIIKSIAQEAIIEGDKMLHDNLLKSPGFQKQLASMAVEAGGPVKITYKPFYEPRNALLFNLVATITMFRIMAESESIVVTDSMSATSAIA